MERLSFSVKLAARRRRTALIEFFEILNLFLIAGFEMNHAWKEALRVLSGKKSDPIYHLLSTDGKSIVEHCLNLSQMKQWGQHAGWFEVISCLYQNGSAISDTIRKITEGLRREDELDLETHQRSLPTKIQILLILFYFPPTVLLLLFPILYGITL